MTCDAASAARDLLAAFREGLSLPSRPDLPLISAGMDIHAIEISPPDDGSGGMSLETFEKTLKYMSRRHLRDTTLDAASLALPSPCLDGYLALLKHYGIRVSALSTDARLLDAQLDAVITYADGIDSLRLSVPEALPGAVPGAGQPQEDPDAWERIVDNLRRLRTVNAHEQFFPVHLEAPLTRANAGQLARHVLCCADFVPPARIRFTLPDRVPPGGTEPADARPVTDVIGCAPCPMLFDNFFVLRNGDLAPCRRGKHILGNIDRDDPDLLVNDPRLLDIRRQHLYGTLDPDLACAGCRRTDPRLRLAFRGFHAALLKHFWREGGWDADCVQPFYDRCIELFRDGPPGEAAFRDACRELLARPVPAPVRPAPPARPARQVAVVGDSLSLPRGVGWGDVPLDATYPEVIRAALDAAETPVDFQVHCLSRRSQTITGIARRIREFAARFPLDYVVIHSGIVDCCPRSMTEAERANLAALPYAARERLVEYLGLNRAAHIASRPMVCKTPLADYRQALADLLEQLAAGATRAAFVLNVAPISPEMEARSPGFAANVAAYNAAIEAVVGAWTGAMAVTVIDVHGLVTRHGAQRMLLPDHQHLNATANARLGRDIAEAILLRENA